MEHRSGIEVEAAAVRRGLEEFGVAHRDPLALLFDAESLSGMERLALLIAANFGEHTPKYWRGNPFRAAVMRPIYQLARPPGQPGQRAAAAEGAAAGQVIAPRTAADLLALLRQRWGKDALAARPTLRRLLRLPDMALLAPDLAAWVTRQRAEGNEVWRVSHQWGLLADVYLADLAAYASMLAKEKSPDAAKVALADTVLLDPESRARIAALPEGGRGTLLAGVHAGAFAYGRRVLRNLLPDLLLLGAHREDSQSEVRVSANDPVRAMLQMVKHLREPGAVAIIGADGMATNAMETVSICGREVKVALGAPHIVHHARCTNAFFLARWEGDRVALDMRTDTQPEPGESLEAWTRRWLAAYVAFVEDIIRGDARNMRGFSGIWSQLDPT
jgi:hypothetical protein